MPDDQRGRARGRQHADPRRVRRAQVRDPQPAAPTGTATSGSRPGAAAAPVPLGARGTSTQGASLRRPLGDACTGCRVGSSRPRPAAARSGDGRRRPPQVRIRSYNVGFGDCFLLTLRLRERADAQRPDRLRLDEASEPRARATACWRSPRRSARTAAASWRWWSRRTATPTTSPASAAKPGEVIASLEPELVVQPWTEDPASTPDAEAPRPAGAARAGARPALVARLVGHAGRWRRRSLERGAAARSSGGVPQDRGRAARASSARPTSRTRPPCGTSMAMGSASTSTPTSAPSCRSPAPARGRASTCSARRRSSSRRRSRTQAQQRTRRVLAPRRARGRRTPRARAATRRRSSRTRRSRGGFPQEARWVIPQIDRMRAEEMLAIVRSARRRPQQHQPDPALRDRRHAAAVPGRRADRELELRALHDADNGGDDPRAARRAHASTRSGTTAASTRPRRRCGTAFEHRKRDQARRTGWSRSSRRSRQARRSTSAARRCRAEALVDELETQESSSSRHRRDAQRGDVLERLEISTSDARPQAGCRIVTVRAGRVRRARGSCRGSRSLAGRRRAGRTDSPCRGCRGSGRLRRSSSSIRSAPGAATRSIAASVQHHQQPVRHARVRRAARQQQRVRPAAVAVRVARRRPVRRRDVAQGSSRPVA